MSGLSWIAATLVVAAGGTLALVALGRDSDTTRLRAEIGSQLDKGGVAELGRAQMTARRLLMRDDGDQEVASALAFVDASLAVDYGMDTDREARTVLARHFPAHQISGPLSPIVAATRALVLLRAGNPEAAARLATEAAERSPGAPYPLYALGRARSRGGDVAGGASALKAASVRSPSFLAARVGWSEARLDLGDPRSAHAILADLLLKAPADLRARLLMDEAEQALGLGPTTTTDRGTATDTLRAACPAPSERWPPASVLAGCALARSSRARRAGARREALVEAEEAARLAPAEPRLQARIAQALAQLGAVDRAATFLDRARRLASPDTPTLAWANLAVMLGRGQAAALPAGPRPADPETSLLVVRASLATGGVGSVAAALDAVGAAAVERDFDLQQLARLRDPGPSAADSHDGEDPVAAYLSGLRSRLQGDLPAAVASLHRALSGHGDACRAAGEYLAMLRVLNRQVDPAAWNLLRAENRSCVNLR